MRIQDGIVAEIMKAQSQGEPLKVYRKAITGKVIVKIIDEFSGDRAELLLEGDPKNTELSEIEVSLWTPMEVTFFERFNKSLIEKGSLIVADRKSEVEIDFSNAIDEEGIKELVTEPYFSMQKHLNNITSETTLQRVLEVAKQVNRPAKTLETIELRLEEVQQGK